MSIHPALRVALALAGSGVVVAGVSVMTHWPQVPWDWLGPSWSDRQVVLLEPRAWTGNRLPILEEIDVGSQLKSGNWVLVFYRRGCESCQTELPRLFDGLSPEEETIGGSRLAVVEIPSDGGDDPLAHVRPSFAAARGTLASGPRWVGRTPLFLHLQDGIVRGFAHSADETLSVIGRGGVEPES